MPWRVKYGLKFFHDNSMHYFPVCLDIANRACVVIGGGQVAERKAKGLLECGAHVTVISPELTEGLDGLHTSGTLSWINRSYQEGDLAEAFLVIAATDDPDVQHRVHAEAEKGNILLNVADVPKWCNFILPATVRRGDFMVSVSTGGKSPALARELRKDLEEQFGSEYGLLVQMLGDLRAKILAQGRSQTENKDMFNRLLHPDMVDWIQHRNWEKVAKHIEKILGGEAAAECLSGLRAEDDHTFAGSKLK